MARNSGTGTSYDAHFYRNGYPLDSGDGLRVRFKVDRGDTAAHFMVEADCSPYRRIGLLANSGKLYVQYTEGAGWIYPQDLLQPVKVGVWYVLRLTLDDAAGFTVEVYEEADPGTAASYTRQMPAGLNWRFHHWTYRGVVELDAYTEWASTQRGSFSYDTLDRLHRRGGDRRRRGAVQPDVCLQPHREPDRQDGSGDLHLRAFRTHRVHAGHAERQAACGDRGEWAHLCLRLQREYAAARHRGDDLQSDLHR